MAYTTINTPEEELKKVQQKAAAASGSNVSVSRQTEPELALPKTSTESAQPDPAAPLPVKSSGGYTPVAGDYDGTYESAMQMLNDTRKNMPAYNSGYDAALQELYSEITSRKAFTYSPSDDALYQNYKQQYVDLGNMAMRDTMGQAAALTGGYGSSYGQSVGQQSYHAYLQQLNNMMPELYGMAYQQYQDEGAALRNQYGMVQDMAQDEYSKYTDRLNAYYNDLGYWQSNANTAYNREQAAEQRDYDRQQDAYAKQQAAYDRLVNMITTMGYTPDADDLAAAGMSAGHMNAYLDYYNRMNAPSGGGGGGRKSNSLYDHVLNAAMKELGKNGVESANSSVMNYVDNGLSVKQAQSIMKKVTDEFMRG